MKLNIQVVCQGDPSIYGETQGIIEIGDDFYEYFIMATNYWTVEDYKRQWKEGLARIMTHSVSCLVASIQHPTEREPLLNWWILYKGQEAIHVQNKLYYDSAYDQIVGRSPITPENCYGFISPRRIYTESGRKISEWSTSLP